MKCEVLINCENPSEVCNVSDASRSGTEEADPDWIPEDEVPPPPKLKLRNLNASLTKKRSHSRFTSAQRAVLLQEYEEHEELLSRTRYDDPDAPVRKLWESVARAVSAVEENAPKTPFICWTKLQPNILQTKQREAWSKWTWTLIYDYPWEVSKCTWRSLFRYSLRRGDESRPCETPVFPNPNRTMWHRAFIRHLPSPPLLSLHPGASSPGNDETPPPESTTEKRQDARSETRRNKTTRTSIQIQLNSRDGRIMPKPPLWIQVDGSWSSSWSLPAQTLARPSPLQV